MHDPPLISSCLESESMRRRKRPVFRLSKVKVKVNAGFLPSKKGAPFRTTMKRKRGPPSGPPSKKILLSVYLVN
ncbi:hypothetical protein C5167_012636 [Papaver somniferum]|uniref:Uncharacterized protein n=1 Tax=Papaver somniferum TaxID=3469 RepID=A0A4Y7J161_PAPSO|nr:hypothetical protein C5167_012636 [Papaver somniferum]